MFDVRIRAACLSGVVAVVVGLCASNVVAQSAASTVISAVEQSARDSDRLRILRDELAREARLVEDQTKRKAERLMVRDAQGAQESEDALGRHAQNIEALRREIDQAQRAAAAPPARASPVAVSATRRSTAVAVTTGAQTAPWWDVYGRAPKRVTASVRDDAAAIAGAAPAASQR